MNKKASNFTLADETREILARRPGRASAHIDRLVQWHEAQLISAIAELRACGTAPETMLAACATAEQPGFSAEATMRRCGVPGAQWPALELLIREFRREPDAVRRLLGCVEREEAALDFVRDERRRLGRWTGS